MLRVSGGLGLGLGAFDVVFGRSAHRIGLNGRSTIANLRRYWSAHHCVTDGQSILSGAQSKGWRNATTGKTVRIKALSPHLRRWASVAIQGGHALTSKAPEISSPPPSYSELPHEQSVPTRAVGYWLLTCSALVFAIIVVGGVTRLTESGLSITEWKPITGVVWPTSQTQWQEEYDKYSQSPEFKLLNSNMTIEDFKKIYFMEWFHRILGRTLGLAFVLPAVYFTLRSRITTGPDKRLAILGAFLIGFQGFLGWFMVRSGLEYDMTPIAPDPNVVPRVSQYRLAAHLGTAIVLYAGMLWRGLSILRDRRAASVVSTVATKVPPAFRVATLFTTGLVFLTAMSGAFVAGLDAGLIYNEFPFMGDSIAPPKKELFAFEPLWRNFFENPSLVQFDHRLMGTLSYTTVMTLFLASLRSGWREAIPAATRRALQFTVLAANLQVLLGISTLLYLVPTELAASHQAGSILLLTALLAMGVTMRRRVVIQRIIKK